jgi:hypothetical protein
MAARLSSSVAEIVLADSPLACVHCEGTAFDMWSALGRPMGHASAGRASRAAGPARHPSGCRAMIGGGSSERVLRQEMRHRGIGAAGVTSRPNSK